MLIIIRVHIYYVYKKNLANDCYTIFMHLYVYIKKKIIYSTYGFDERQRYMVLEDHHIDGKFFIHVLYMYR